MSSPCKITGPGQGGNVKFAAPAFFSGWRPPAFCRFTGSYERFLDVTAALKNFYRPVSACAPAGRCRNFDFLFQSSAKSLLALSVPITVAQLLQCEHEYLVTFESELEDVACCLNTHYSGFDYLGIVRQVAHFAREHEVVFDAYTIKAWVEGATFNMEWRTEPEAPGSEFIIERSLVKQAEQTVAYHHRLSLPVRLQGQGLVKPLLRAFYDQYRQVGVDKIRLVAGKYLGGYFWAKLGFYAVDSQAVRDILEAGRIRDVSHESLTAWYSIFTAFYQQHPFEAPFPMILLSNEPDGKNLLKGTSWDGVMDLHNRRHCATFETYLGIRNV